MIPFISPSWWKVRRFKAELSRQVELAVQETANKWLFFNNTIFLEDDSAASKIEAFVPPIMEFYKSKYPILLVDTRMAWSVILTAVKATRTEDDEELLDIQSALAQIHNFTPPQHHKQ